MKRFLRKIYDFFAGLFTRDFGEKLYAGITRAVPYVRKAYEVCSLIAELTPNRSIKEVLNVANKFGVEAFAYGSSIEEGLRHIAFQVLRRTFPDAPDSAINLAIEMAVNALKAEKERNV